MRSLKILLICIVSFLVSCKIITKKNYNRIHSFNEFLIETQANNTYYSIPQLEITNEKIYPILDSLVSMTESCDYFDERLKSLYSFYISTDKSNSNDSSYNIYAHLSVEETLGLLVNNAVGISNPKNVGVFYYNGYSFAVPISDNNDNTDFPFVIKKKCNYMIRSTKLHDKNTYSSYLTFQIENGAYKIKKNEVCGKKILITSQ